MPRLLPPLTAVLAAVLVTLPGCGEDAFSTTSSAVDVTLDEYLIAPQEIRVQHRRLKFTASNVGRLPHNFVIQIPAETREDQPVEIARVPTLRPGETDSVKVSRRDLKPGEYELLCTIGNHDGLGQYGTLVVEESTG